MKRKDRKVIAERKRHLQKRMDRRNFTRAGKPIFAGGNVQYVMADRVRGFACGAIGAMHTMVQGLGLDAALNDARLLLKIHAPYFESDHVLNMTYNILTGESWRNAGPRASRPSLRNWAGSVARGSNAW